MATLDYAVIVAYLLGTLVVGIWISRRNRSEEEYLLGGGKMSSLSLGLSLFASLLSTITYLGVPGEIISLGPMYLSQYLAFPLIFVVAGYFIIPRIVREPVTSAYEILETRLGKSVRHAAEVLFFISRLAWMGMILHTTCSKVLAPLLGFDSSWTPLFAAVLGIITLVYTTWGGFRAVVFTDVVQASILLCGALACIILAAVQTDGIANWWPTTTPEGWQNLVWINAPGGSRTFLAMIFLAFTWFVSTSGSDQVAVQRYLANRDVKAARRTLGVSLIVQLLAVGLLAVIGFGLVRYYTMFADRLPIDAETGKQLTVRDADKLFPAFIASEIPVGLSGLILAALLAAAMSSLSSGISAATSVVTVKLFPDRAQRERHGSAPARWIALIVGSLAVVLSLGIGFVEGNLIEQTTKVVNLLVAPLFGLFVMALFIPRASAAATLIGLVFGVATAVLISFWQELFGAPCPLSLFYGMPASLVVQTLVGTVLCWSLLPPPTRPISEESPAHS
mgnify:CR=1 FL=1